MFPPIKKDETLKASKFLKHQFLLSTDDFKFFFSQFESIVYIPTGKVFKKEEGLSHLQEFYDSYDAYLRFLLDESDFDVSRLRVSLSGGFSLFEEAFGCQIVANDSRLYKPIKPVMQFQLLSFIVGIDKKLHFTFGKEALYIGLQVLYPQLFIDEHHQIKNGLKVQESKNAKLFKDFVSFLREKTQLISFEIEGKTIRSQIRINPRLFEKLQHLQKFSKYKMTLC